MTAVLVVAGGVLALSALLVTLRMAMGPTMLDRAIAFDVIVSISIAAIAVDAAVRRTSDNLPLLLVATLLGFVGSISLARFSPGSDDVDAERDETDETDETDEEGTP
ncbi:monovalent cation/H+ antiporter complex subunit F [Nocardioides plantarum]|uniref:Monovalent cation/H+ antiporter complex subunit F n=1 Tax=Nocardioides plantarum TaxID=29299 RepID=A0ABV5K9W8_9ACTN|nr:monovalent cation/H+ antiporter complex subunit F [Nocardioides plantarum]